MKLQIHKLPDNTTIPPQDHGYQLAEQQRGILREMLKLTPGQTICIASEGMGTKERQRVAGRVNYLCRSQHIPVDRKYQVRCRKGGVFVQRVDGVDVPEPAPKKEQVIL